VDEMEAVTLKSLQDQLLAEGLTSRVSSLGSVAGSDGRRRLVRSLNSRNNELDEFSEGDGKRRDGSIITKMPEAKLRESRRP
jgi:hypothetical protein